MNGSVEDAKWYEESHADSIQVRDKKSMKKKSKQKMNFRPYGCWRKCRAGIAETYFCFTSPKRNVQLMHASATVKKLGDAGQPCLTPRSRSNSGPSRLLSETIAFASK